MKHIGKAIGLFALLTSGPGQAQLCPIGGSCGPVIPRCSIGDTVGRANVYAVYPGPSGGEISFGASSSPVNPLPSSFLRATQTSDRLVHRIRIDLKAPDAKYSIGRTMAFAGGGQSLGEAPVKIVSDTIRIDVPDAVRASDKPFVAVVRFNGRDVALQFDALPDPVSWARKYLIDRQRAGTLPKECRRHVRP